MDKIVARGERNNQIQNQYKVALDDLITKQRAYLRNKKIILDKNSTRSKRY